MPKPKKPTNATFLMILNNVDYGKGQRMNIGYVRGGLDLDHQYLTTVETTMHIHKHYCIFLQMQLDRNATVAVDGDYFYGVNEKWSIQYGLPK